MNLFIKFKYTIFFFLFDIFFFSFLFSFNQHLNPILKFDDCGAEVRCKDLSVHMYIYRDCEGISYNKHSGGLS